MSKQDKKNEFLFDLLNQEEKTEVLNRQYIYATEQDFKYLIESSIFLIIKFGNSQDIKAFSVN